VGESLACYNETSQVKGPSSYTTFFANSTTVRCSNVTLYLIRSSSFLVSKSNAHVSFQFDNQLTQGVVVNHNGATIGRLVGDGSVLKFGHPERLLFFEVCLNIRDSDSSNHQYPVKDFGYSTQQLAEIYPLNFTNSLHELVIAGSLTYWCVNVSMKNVPTENGNVILFPIYRLDNYASVDKELYQHSTVALVYTLGACYCFDLFLILIFVGIILYERFVLKRTIPVMFFIAMLLVCICIFRIVFCFLWPVGGFDGNPLAEYVVFEIPTFFLFSVMIVAIAFWRKISRKRY